MPMQRGTYTSPGGTLLFATLRRAVAASVLAAVAATTLVVGSVTPAGAGTVAADAESAVRSIIFPVAGPSNYSDTFGACRSGCSRGHEGTDIMTAKLTRLVAARDATVTWLRDDATPDGSRGNYLMLRDAEGWEYWYIHLNNDSPGTDDGANPKQWIFGPGIAKGSTVEAGQLVGYAGDSGNAESSGSHLHFEIHKPDGSVINPYRSLNAATRLSQPAEAGSRRGDRAFVRALYADFLGRPASDGEVETRTNTLAQTRDRAAMVREFATSDEWITAVLDGYYRTTLGRKADAGGRAYWTDQMRRGLTASQVAVYFYASDEYHARSGGTDRAWLTDLYEQLLQRAPDAGGLQYWHDQLSSGTSRPVAATYFYGSLESRRMRVTNLYGVLLDRRPDPEGHAYWADVLTDGHDIRLATNLAASLEYHQRAGRRF